MPAPLDNQAIAQRLDAFAALLDLAGSGRYTSRAYRRAAETIRETRAPVEELVRAGRVQELRGIGPGIANRLRELVETGTIAELDELERVVQPELVGLGRLLGVSAKRMLEIGRVLGVRTVDELRAAAREGRLQEVRGIGPSTEKRLLERLEQERTEPRQGLTLNRARDLTEEVAVALRGQVAGDPRRWADVSFELAVVVASDEADAVLERFESLPAIVAVVERAPGRAVGVTVEGIPLELVVRRAGPLRHGPPACDRHSPLRRRAWGRSPKPPMRRMSSRPSASPGVRPSSARSRFAACRRRWSSLTTSAATFTATRPGPTARRPCSRWAGPREISATSTSRSATTRATSGSCPGLDADDLRRQAEEIAAANEELAPFRVLRGTEVDIRSDGALDLSDDVLAELDWVQLSLHAGQREARGPLTKKVIEAMRHPAVTCLSHPHGRIINHRPPNALDLEAVIETALETGVALETNGLPDRLDLAAPQIRLAIEAGVPIVASTDAHSIRGLGNMRLAIATARRGWATTADIVNTRPLDALPLRA